MSTSKKALCLPEVKLIHLCQAHFVYSECEPDRDTVSWLLFGMASAQPFQKGQFLSAMTCLDTTDASDLSVEPARTHTDFSFLFIYTKSLSALQSLSMQNLA